MDKPKDKESRFFSKTKTHNSREEAMSLERNGEYPIKMFIERFCGTAPNYLADRYRKVENKIYFFEPFNSGRIHPVQRFISIFTDTLISWILTPCILIYPLIIALNRFVFLPITFIADLVHLDFKRIKNDLIDIQQSLKHFVEFLKLSPFVICLALSIPVMNLVDFIGGVVMTIKGKGNLHATEKEHLEADTAASDKLHSCNP